MIEVIGLSGKIGSGKDYIARKYFYPMGYHRWSLADHFKIMIIGKGEATYAEVFHTKPPKVRDLLQQEGTERGRMVYGEDVWVDVAFAWMELLSNTMNIKKFIIPDVRFKNEVAAIQNRGGKVIRIIAPEREVLANPSIDAQNHISEKDLDDFPIDSFDGIIFNDPKYEHTVGMQIRTILGVSPIEVPPKPEGPPTIDIPEGYTVGMQILEKLTDQFEKAGDQIEKLYNSTLGQGKWKN